jgi:hypothetical protein
MPRLLPSQVLRFLASLAAILLLSAHPRAAAQQKPASTPPQSKAQLEDRVNQLEIELRAAEQKAEKAAMEKDYILRAQNHYETYYKEVFSTQTHILWTIGITVTLLSVTLSVVFFVAGRFGFNIFDRRIDLALREASAQLRTEFTQLLGKETKALQDTNATLLKTLEDGLSDRITQQVQDLETRSNFQLRHAEGLAGGADNRNTAARASFRWALKIYKSGRPRKLFPKRAGALAAKNLFTAIQLEDEANFVENAKKELANQFYDDLEEELALAAVDLNWLTPLLAERKSAASQPVAAEPKTDVAPAEPSPAAAQKDDK